jgi:Putative adhesin
LTPAFVKAAMHSYILAFAVVALATPALDAAAQEAEHINRTIKLDPGGTLRLKNFSGRVSITATERPEVVIDAVRRAPRGRLERIRLDIHTEGSNVVVIDANHRDRSWFEFIGGNNVVETDFDIQVPRRTDLDVAVFSSAVTIADVEGSHKVHSFSGQLTLNDVAGPLRAHTFSGTVVIRQKTGEDQNIDVDTFSGDVELHVPDSARGSVSFNSFSGRLNSVRPLTFHNSSRRALLAELGSGGNGRMRFKTFSGSVRIDR